MSGFAIALLLAAGVCIDRGARHLSMAIKRQVIKSMDAKINKQQIPNLLTAAESSKSEAEKNSMYAWIGATQGFVNAILGVADMKGRDVKEWTLLDITFIAKQVEKMNEVHLDDIKKGQGTND
jgi:hypothetical protein